MKYRASPKSIGKQPGHGGACDHPEEARTGDEPGRCSRQMEFALDRPEYERHRAKIDGVEKEGERDDDEQQAVIGRKWQALEARGGVCAKRSRGKGIRHGELVDWFNQ